MRATTDKKREGGREGYPYNQHDIMMLKYINIISGHENLICAYSFLSLVTFYEIKNRAIVCYCINTAVVFHRK